MKKRNLFRSPVLEKNEIDANKTISLASFVAALVLVILWVLYIVGIFYTTSMVSVNIAFPILIALLLSPIVLRKTKLVEYKWYKYYLFGSFILVIFLTNIVVPTYGMLIWAVIFPIASHYYSRKSALIAFLICAVLMALSIPLSIVFGEFNPILFGTSENEFKSLCNIETLKPFDPDSTNDRFYYLAHPEIYGQILGYKYSRWIFAYLYLYIPSLLVVTIVYVLCSLLARRTSRLLESERKATGDNEKMRSELDVASSIQKSVLPMVAPNNNYFRIHAVMNPSKEVGGDFYDYYFIDKDRFLFVVGDVSGKSVPGAMFMMKTETTIKSLAPLNQESDKILFEVNNALTENNAMNMYVTVWLGILDFKKRTITYTNAGHNSPLLLKGEKVTFLSDKHNSALGILPNRKYDVNKIKMKKGDKIFLYTDGVTEAHNENNELYGENRLVRVIKSNVANSPKMIISSISSDINKFKENRPQFDDITMLILEVTK